MKSGCISTRTRKGFTRACFDRERVTARTIPAVTGECSECTVLAVSSTVKFMVSCRSGPTARSFSSAQRLIMSSSTRSSAC